MLTINELLYKRGLPKNAKTKFVRHADIRFPLYDNYKFEKEKFLFWQSEQSKPVFHNCEFIVSFLGDVGKRSRFIGVYKVNGFKVGANNIFYYDLSEVEGFEDIKERVIVDWASIQRSWHQWVSNVEEKPIIEILPINTFHQKSFSDYLDFILDFSELKEIIKNRDTFKDWFLMLSAVKGIYLILDKSTGNKYIGSAYSEDGIFGRWEEYVNTNGHGNNKRLKELIESDKTYARHFQYTILMTLPKTMTAQEVIKREQLFKQKLGSRSFGLNEN
jgi:hypothetical protein